MDIADMPQCSIFVIFISTNAKFFAATKKVIKNTIWKISPCFPREVIVKEIHQYQQAFN
jgi:hypothetical protein